MSSNPSSPDPDLRDVFKLLYADDDWIINSESKDENEVEVENQKEEVHPHPPMNSIIPEIEVDIVESALIYKEGSDLIPSQKKYSRKRYLEALDSLLSSSSTLASISNQPSTKRTRIYPTTPSILPSSSSSSIILATQPIPKLPSPPEYLPYSPLGLLSKLRTYQIHSYDHPEWELSPIGRSLNGWVIIARDTFYCHQCGVKWGLGGLDEIRDESVRREVIRRLSRGFESRHGRGCAWRVNRSPDNLYEKLRNSLHPLISTNITTLSSTLSSSIPKLCSINVKTPLSPTQEDRLVSSIQHHHHSSSSSSNGNAAHTRESILLAFFGWFPYFPNSPKNSDHIVPPEDLDEDKEKEKKVEKTEIVHCRICQRRIGLWGFTKLSHQSTPILSDEKSKSISEEDEEDRVLDLVHEHLNWCPLNVQLGKGESTNRWWEDSQLIKEKLSIRQDGFTKDWVKVSDKLEKKPWRR